MSPRKPARNTTDYANLLHYGVQQPAGQDPVSIYKHTLRKNHREAASRHRHHRNGFRGSGDHGTLILNSAASVSFTEVCTELADLTIDEPKHDITESSIAKAQSAIEEPIKPASRISSGELTRPNRGKPSTTKSITYSTRTNAVPGFSTDFIFPDRSKAVPVVPKWMHAYNSLLSWSSDVWLPATAFEQGSSLVWHPDYAQPMWVKPNPAKPWSWAFGRNPFSYVFPPGTTPTEAGSLRRIMPELAHGVPCALTKWAVYA